MSLQKASMILRIAAYPPLTTKGSELTWEELDGNLIKIYQDIAAKVKAGTIPDFDSAKTYNLGDAANYNDVTWLYLNATPEAGIDPGSDPAYWGEIDPTFFIHEQNKDTYLDKGGANEVTAAQLKTLVAAGVPITIYTGNGSLPSAASRKFNLNTGKLFTHNGIVFYGTDDPEWFIVGFPLPHPMQLKGDGNFGMIVANAEVAGYSYSAEDSGNGFLADFPGDGSAFIARMGDVNSIGLNIKASTNKIFDSNIDPDPTNENSSILTVWSTRQGTLPFPRMYTSQRDAILFPAPGLLIQNEEIGFPQINHETYGWQSIGYGAISYRIDFSVTPFSGSPISFETRIPAGKIIHKIVAIGTAIDVSVADAIDIGLTSDTTYFSPDILLLNAESGQSSSGNSKRTVSANEDLIINPNGAVSSGVLEFTVYHT